MHVVFHTLPGKKVSSREYLSSNKNLIMGILFFSFNFDVTKVLRGF